MSGVIRAVRAEYLDQTLEAAMRNWLKRWTSTQITVEGHCDCMFMVNTYRWDYAMLAAMVLFPTPDAPTTATISPACTSRSRSRTPWPPGA